MAVVGLLVGKPGMSAHDAGADTPMAVVRRLAGAGSLVGAWALLPPYTGPVLNTSARVEFADHVVPGIVVVVISILALFVGRRGEGHLLLFVAGLGVVLAGLWMSATHLPLVVQATRGEAPWGATVYHGLPGLAVLVLGVTWAITYRAEPTPNA